MSQCIVPITEDTLVKKFEPNEPYYAARWMVGRLISPTLLKNIDLEVYIRKMKYRHGICYAYEKFPLNYTVVINSELGRRESLRLLAHESYHVMQYATGKMKDMWGQDNKGRVLWKNQLMEDNEDSFRAYYNSPWEKEAYAGQEKLLQAYLQHVKRLIG